mmetsp:Transcript_24083/g.60303  ORF Transcript_24083/g.60303 Transcript_24083/m.60303 type:complete len:107 (+) Transcript_24083:464-784(+)
MGELVEQIRTVHWKVAMEERTFRLNTMSLSRLVELVDEFREIYRKECCAKLNLFYSISPSLPVGRLLLLHSAWSMEELLDETRTEELLCIFEAEVDSRSRTAPKQQ